MKLSELLVLNDQLREVDTSTHYIQDQVLVQSLRDMLAVSPPVDAAMMANIERLVLQKRDAVDELQMYLASYYSRSIADLREPYAKQSNIWAQHLDTYDYKEWVTYRDSIYGHHGNFLHEYVSGRIKGVSSWQYPALIYHLDTADYLNELFGFYPIYVVDKWKESQHLLDEKYNQAQVRKIRMYDLDRLMHLPNRCMGYAVSRNHFTHCNMEQFANELKWLLTLMLPGSTIAFNINDCENYKCAELFEQGIRSFLLGAEVKKAIDALGLKVTTWQYLDEASTVWVEVRVPGVLQSIKRAEALGHIVGK